MNPHGPASPEWLYRQLEPHLSAGRLAPYVRAAEGDRGRAVDLYQQNVELSGAVYEALHIVEVVLRNAMDHQLSSWNCTQKHPNGNRLHTEEWLIDPSRLLRRLVREADLRKARTRAMRAIEGRLLTHGDLVAQMSLGTWRFLLPDHDPGRQYLWRTTLHRAFPHLAAPPEELVGVVDGLYRLRNRVAHLEPLLRLERVRHQLQNMVFVTAAIDPTVHDWFRSVERITASLRGRR